MRVPEKSAEEIPPPTVVLYRYISLLGSPGNAAPPPPPHSLDGGLLMALTILEFFMVEVRTSSISWFQPFLDLPWFGLAPFSVKTDQ
jgi:hypothetical protein